MISRTPSVYQADIVARFMQPDALASFQESYLEARKKHHRGMSEPSENDMRIAAVVRETKSYAVASKQLGISAHRIANALARVAAFADN